MTAWRVRLAVLQAQSEAFAEIYASANSANRCAASTPAEAIGANGTGIDLAEDPWAALHCILAAAPAGAGRSTSWLQSIAGSIAEALADGARRERDADGYLALVRPDGRPCARLMDGTAALEYMRSRALARPVIELLAAHPAKVLADEAGWTVHLAGLGIDQFAVPPNETCWRPRSERRSP